MTLSPPTLWLNQGLSSTHDALLLLREGAARVGLRPILIASHSDALIRARLPADLVLPEPALDPLSPAYRAWLLETCRQHRVDLLLAHRGRFGLGSDRLRFASAGTRLIIPCDPATATLLEDKARFYRLIQEAGEPAPRFRIVTDAASLAAAMADLAPEVPSGLCVKPAIGVFGQGFWRLVPGEDPAATLLDPDRRRIDPQILLQMLRQSRKPGRLLLMEYLPGRERSIDCVTDRGRLIAAVIRLKKGETQMIEDNPRVLALVSRLVARFRLSGLVNVQTRDRADGSPAVLEINARMSGGLRYTAASGLSLPWILAAQALGLPGAEPVPQTYGARILLVNGMEILPPLPPSSRIPGRRHRHRHQDREEASR